MPYVRASMALAMIVALLCSSVIAWGQQADAPAKVVPAVPPTTQGGPPSPAALPAPVAGIVKELRSGPLLIHGNYCGIGNRPGAAPIDALDAACMRHDACTKTGKLPNCACDDRLRIEASAIAQDPHAPVEEQTVAAATATAMAVLICKVTPKM